MFMLCNIDAEFMNLLADFATIILAFCGLLFSIYSFKKQQKRENRFAKASVRPILSIKSKIYENNKTIQLMNYGIGPAIIKKAIFEDQHGNKSENIIDLFDSENLFGKQIKWDTYSTIPENKTLEANGEIILIQLTKKNLLKQGIKKETALKILTTFQEKKSGLKVSVKYTNIYGNNMPALIDALK